MHIHVIIPGIEQKSDICSDGNLTASGCVDHIPFPGCQIVQGGWRTITTSRGRCKINDHWQLCCWKERDRNQYSGSLCRICYQQETSLGLMFDLLNKIKALVLVLFLDIFLLRHRKAFGWTSSSGPPYWSGTATWGESGLCRAEIEG